MEALALFTVIQGSHEEQIPLPNTMPGKEILNKVCWVPSEWREKGLIESWGTVTLK